ncbi:MAG: N-acetyl-gamma-glutamyl-phosphate reductase [Candidatus Freyarchaeota archaeon]|nr:N-acetyl-gamma-glutamyl-phosphate reductase [Candidatus Freyrarchaeum guaymaensis]HDO80338.1 N-acetyl-gamma-glutamyl-phosphate reductase [Candidatus Bathyarchaeota archaeon]
MRVGIVGGSGYTGGELLRLLCMHPKVEVTYVTSRRYAGKFIGDVHPNLRKLVNIKFEEYDVTLASEKCDYVFMAVPHRSSMKLTPDLLDVGLKVIDLSADFRLKDKVAYEKYYGGHERPELLEEAVYGLPELHREELRGARLVACPGCIAVSAILGAAPIVASFSIDPERIVVDAKIGSSAAGREATESTHHPERVGVVRPYKVTGHRHTAEIEQELSMVTGRQVKVALSAHSIDMVRGILSTIHFFLDELPEEKDVWRAFRAFYGNEPFVRIVKQKTGLYRLPNPKAVVGSNFCDVGFELDPHASRLVVLSALDNLVKGAAGQAVQCMNVMEGWDEALGLNAPSIFP